jgi:hypothetical protein
MLLSRKLFLEVFSQTPQGQTRFDEKTMTDLRHLVAAPELLVCDLTDHTLAILVRALLVEHPSLSYESRIGRRARDVVRVASRLRRAILTYRLAVDESLDDLERDLPF